MKRLAAVCVVLLAACAPVPPQLDSPLFLPQPRRAAYLPLVQVEGYTRKCRALDTWQATGSVAAQIATLPEGGCGHIWWTPMPLPEGLWPACRSVRECEALDGAALAAQRPGAVVLLLNEPNNSDTVGGGWPETPERAAERLAAVVDRMHAAGLKAACCGVYVARTDPLGGAAWMERYFAAGGRADAVHYHVFGRTASDARRVMRRAEALWPGPLIVSEAGWCEQVKRAVEATDGPRYLAVFTLATVHCP